MFNFLFEGKIGEYLAPVLPNNQLYLAIQHHKNNEVQQFILSGQSDFRRVSDTGYAAIHIACRYNNLIALELIIQQGVSYDTPDSQGNLPLHYAAKYGHIDLCKVLVERGCSAAKKNSNNQTPYDLSESHVVRQYLLPIQLQAESAGQDAGHQLHPGISYGSMSSIPSASYHHISPPVNYAPALTMEQPSAYSIPTNLPPMNHVSLNTNQIAPPPTNSMTNTQRNSAVSGSNSTRFIQPDGFHSSASDPALQAKYGHVKATINIAPPPTASSLGSLGAPPQQFGMYNSHPPGTIPSNSSTVPTPIFNRYVAYDPHTNAAVAPSVPQVQPPGVFHFPPPPYNQSMHSGAASGSAVFVQSGLMSPPIVPQIGQMAPKNIHVFNPATDCDVVNASDSSNSVM